ncbi:MAG: carbonic anhydrase family protein [Bacteroidia bacterium]
MKTLSFEDRQNLTPSRALDLLIKGNERFVNNLSVNRDHKELISTFSKEQKPYAFILGCIDSRVPIEIVFDQGLGDLFVARVAGNIINDDLIASAEFAVSIVGVKIIMILGHTNCGAIRGYLSGIRTGYLKNLMEKIEPAYLKYKEKIDGSENPPDFLSMYNAIDTAEQLYNKSEIIKNAIHNHQILITSAIYDIETGKVSILNKIPVK